VLINTFQEEGPSQRFKVSVLSKQLTILTYKFVCVVSRCISRILTTIECFLRIFSLVEID
jgi:hypothetical protein